jgi:hypothetical protein
MASSKDVERFKGQMKMVPSKANLFWLVKLPEDDIATATRRVGNALRPLNLHKHSGYSVLAISGAGEDKNGMFVIRVQVGTKTDDPDVLDDIQSQVDSVLDSFPVATEKDVVKR